MKLKYDVFKKNVDGKGYQDYYFFNDKGLYFRKFSKGKAGDYRTVDTFLAGFIITDCKIYENDNLSNVMIDGTTLYDMDIFIPSRNKNYQFRNKTFKSLINSIYNKKVALIDLNELMNIITIFLIYFELNQKIIIEDGVSYTGFFLNNNGEVIHDQSLDYNLEDLNKAIGMLNDICDKRQELSSGLAFDVSVYRFMLWSPFSFVFKQLGLMDFLYGLILQGESDTNKSTSVNIGRYFYDYRDPVNVSSVSALGSLIADGSFPAVVDEARYLLTLKETREVAKNTLTSFSCRAVKSREDNTKTDNFLALSVPVFIYNGFLSYPFEMHKRYKILDYVEEMRIPVNNDVRIDFTFDYNVDAINSPLIILRNVGCAFASYLIQLIDKEELKDILRRVRGDLEKLVMYILKLIEREAGVCFHEAFYDEVVDNIVSVKDVVQVYLQKQLAGAIKYLGKGSDSDYQAILTVFRRNTYRWLVLCNDGRVALAFDRFYEDIRGDEELRDIELSKDVLWDAIGIDSNLLEGRDKSVSFRKENGKTTSWKNVVFLSMDEVVNKVFQFNMKIEE